MYHKLIYLVTLTLLVASCNVKKKTPLEQRVHPSDSFCIKEIAQAKVDIKSQKLVYCYYVGNIAYQPLRSEKEMKNLLQHYGIEYENESSPCVIQENRIYNCYCEIMQEQINEKYGDQFTDSLLHVADSLWILKNRNEVFDCGSTSTCWDKPALFPGDKTYDRTNHSGLQEEFDKLVRYPADYRMKKGKKSMAFLQVYLDIDEKGHAKVTKTYFDFWDGTKQDYYNEKYGEYLKSIAIPLIENTIWTPATIKGIGVKSKNDIFIYLK